MALEARQRYLRLAFRPASAPTPAPVKLRNVKGVDPQEQLRQRRFNQLRAGCKRLPKGKKHKAKIKAKAKARKAAKAHGKKKKA
ncbi:hypothetical protein OF846_002508 [Rhodotorula toruloides]|nr:hypothetical protein OF846_002508 [Rhodotorula toruloides]